MFLNHAYWYKNIVSAVPGGRSGIPNYPATRTDGDLLLTSIDLRWCTNDFLFNYNIQTIFLFSIFFTRYCLRSLHSFWFVALLFHSFLALSLSAVSWASTCYFLFLPSLNRFGGLHVPILNNVNIYTPF